MCSVVKKKITYFRKFVLSNKDGALNKFIAFGHSKFGSDFGWKTRYAELLGISQQQITDILAERSPIGPKMRERLRAAGCDMTWFDSEESLPITKQKDVTYWESRTGHFTEQEKKDLDKFIKELLTEDDQDNRKSAMDVARVILKKGKKKKE